MRSRGRIDRITHLPGASGTARRSARAGRLVVAAGVLLASACNSGGSGNEEDVPATVPDFSAASFSASTQVDNPFFTLTPGKATTYVERSADGSEVIVVEVLATQRFVNGVTCVVVRDRVYEDDLLLEDTHDFFAQDDAGNVWYMGEEVTNYEYDDEGNLVGTNHDGAWETGLDVAGLGTIARPGWVMKAAPAVGDRYHQEWYRGAAEDFGEVLALDAQVTLSDGRSFTCLKTRDSSTLGGGEEHKYYAHGVGLVLEEQVGSSERAELKGSFVPGPASVPNFAGAVFTDPTRVDNPWFPLQAGIAFTYLAGPQEDESEEDGEELAAGEEEEIETIVVELQEDTRVVAGVTCAVVRDRVFLDGLLQEDTFDWYAQDDLGNVWYMGEEVTNYEYDEEGNEIGTNDDGSWEAGLDVAGTGSIAEPGHQMKAEPRLGDSYHQEFYEGEAVDMGLIAREATEVVIDDEVSYEDCLQVLEWNPLEPGALEYKFAAPGVGVVAEQGLHSGEQARLLGRFDRGGGPPDFGAATFGDPTAIDNELFPLPVGRVLTYESETEDGLETVIVTVTADTVTILGVECVVVNVTEDLDGLLIEETFDWYAQDDEGNVWYMGEDVTNYEYDEDGNLIGTDDEGSWEAGQDGAEAGHLMPAAPSPGASFYQELFEGEAEDMAYVVALGVEVELGDGTPYEDCLKTLEWNPLEPDGLEYKYYAPGVGLVLEQDLVDGETLELVGLLGP